MTTIYHRYATVEGRHLFYREAGPPGAPVVVLLHGFPASSFMFRNLIPVLAGQPLDPLERSWRTRSAGLAAEVTTPSGDCWASGLGPRSPLGAHRG